MIAFTYSFPAQALIFTFLKKIICVCVYSFSIIF